LASASSGKIPSITPAVTGNRKRAAGKTAECCHDLARLVLIIGVQPPEGDERLDRAALEVAYETDLAL